MNRINLDIVQDIESRIFTIKSDPNQDNLRQLKNLLNKFFPDTNCKEIIYTQNIDKVFFGMCVYPMINGDKALNLLTSDNNYRIDSYYLEIDSKLLDPVLNLSAKEITAVLLHEIGHLANTSTPIEDVKDAVNVYLSKHNQHLSLDSSKQYKELLAFAIKDSVQKIVNIFNKNIDEEVVADEFVVKCGLGPDLESALRKITNKAGKLNSEVNNKFIVLQWTLNLYKDVKLKRISALHALNRGKQITASVLQKREINSVIRNLQQIDDDRLIVESITDIALAFSQNVANIYKDIKYKGVRSLEEDYYDLALRVKNVDDKDEALMILRQINIRLSIVEDYLNSGDVDPNKRDKLFDVMNKYRTLRDILSKKETYTKIYGLFQELPVVKNRYEV